MYFSICLSVYICIYYYYMASSNQGAELCDPFGNIPTIRALSSHESWTYVSSFALSCSEWPIFRKNFKNERKKLVIKEKNIILLGRNWVSGWHVLSIRKFVIYFSVCVCTHSGESMYMQSACIVILCIYSCNSDKRNTRRSGRSAPSWDLALD